MRIKSRKIRKILGRVWTAPKRIFETFLHSRTTRCTGMNATHITFYLIRKSIKGFFLYYIPCKENKCWKKFLKLSENRYLIIISNHILKLEISGCDIPHDIQEKLHFSEKEYFKNHSAAIKSYISEMDIDLTVVWCFSVSYVFSGMR
jgi:hypothetical protein